MRSHLLNRWAHHGPPELSLIFIMPDRDRMSWGAVWQGGGENKPLGEFDGGRDEAIAWARQRSNLIMIFSEKAQDLVRLPPDSDIE